MPSKSWYPFGTSIAYPNGNVLITGYPFIIEVTRDGEIVWQLQYTDMASVAEARLGLNEGIPSSGFYKAQRISTGVE